MLAGGAREASASGEPAGASSNIPRTGENPGSGIIRTHSHTSGAVQGGLQPMGDASGGSGPATRGTPNTGTARDESHGLGLEATDSGAVAF